MINHDRTEENDGWQARTERLIGEPGIDRLGSSTVMVVGLGGVGSYCAETLVRAGIGTIILVDGDVVSLSNINRQIIAVTGTVGKPKAEVMARRALEINPDCRAYPRVQWVGAENVNDLLAPAPDYVADAIDSIECKLDLIEACLKYGVRIVSSMGAGNKMDPTRFMIADISKTHTCPMAKAVRIGLRKRGIETGLTCVFSDEPPVVHAPGPPGSIAMAPPAAGLAMASVIVRKLLGT